MQVAIERGFAYLRRMGKEAQNVATLDWSQCPAVESIPGKVSGAWVFKGTRTPAAIVPENLDNALDIEEALEQLPVKPAPANEALEFAARSLDAPVVPGR